jgi:predicted nucleotidyltransferase component of viral defense system
MTRVQRDTVAGRAYLDVQNLARRSGRPTDELLHLYALEGFLARLSGSADSDRLVLKGGMLLAVWDARRPTRDIDLAGRRLLGEVDAVRDLVRTVAALQVDDGLDFDPRGVAAGMIRDEHEYAGVRVTVPGRLARAVIRFHVDVNIGDPIRPPPVPVDLPRLLGGDPVRILGYPLAMVLAEKLVTMVERAEANTRWRDFADVYQLTRDQAVPQAELREAIDTVAAFRGVRLHPLASLLGTYLRLAQDRWFAWRRKQALERALPEDFGAVLRAVAAFADPFLTENGETEGPRV